MEKELARLQAGYAALSKEMETAQRASAHPDNLKVYDQQLAAMNKLKSGYKDVAGLDKMIQATGSYSVESIKAASSTTQFAKSLAEQKVGISSFITNFSKMRAQVRAFTDEQIALSKASAMQWTTNGVGGKSDMSLYVPKDVGPALRDVNARLGAANYVMGQLGKSTLNWGKNTQWAGRQLTAGLTMPLMLAAAGIATVAYKVNQEITNIVKMYNTSDIEKAYTDPAQQAIAKERELAQVRKNALDNAIAMAKQYGSAINDTLEIEAQMASKGYTGAGLQQMTNATMKMSAVGNISPTDAMGTTMSMISAYKIAPNQLNEAMNFLNALKNNTNLTMQDISNAIPRVGATLASLVPPSEDANKALKETGVMLAAFAEGGVQASQGANALKTAIARAFDPVPKAQKEFAKLTSSVQQFAGAGGKGIDLSKIKDASGGDPLTYFTNLGKAMANIDAQSKETALKDLFGIQQSNRMLVMLQNLMGAGANTQTGQAEKLARSSADIWANITNQEIQQFQESASGKLKIAVQTMKGEFAKLGGPIVSALSPVLHVITSIIKALNGLPSPIKSFGAWALIIMGIVGPITMLVGLMANLAGMTLKTASSFSNLFLKFKPMTAEAKANEIIAKMATQTYNAEAQAVGLLALKMKDLTDVMLTNQEAQALIPKTGGSVSASMARGQMTKAGYGVGAGTVAGEQMALLGDSARTATEETAKTKVNLRAIGGSAMGLGIAALSIKELASGTSSWGTQLLNVGLILTSIGGVAGGGLLGGVKKNFAEVVATAGGLEAAGGRFKVIWTVALNALQAGFKGLKAAALWMVTSPIGITILALAAAAVAIDKLIRNANKLSAAQEEVNKSTSAWAAVLGYTETQMSLSDKGMKNGITDFQARAEAVKKLTEQNNSLVTSLERLNTIGPRAATNVKVSEQLYEAAVTEALKVAASGGTATNAKQAFEVALQAGGASQADIKTLDVKFEHVNLSDPKQITDEIGQQINTALQDVKPDEKVALDFWDKTFHPDGLKDSARAAINDATSLMTRAMASATSAPQKFDVFHNFEDQMNGFWSSQYNSIKGSSKQMSDLMKKAGIDSIDSMGQAYEANINGHATDLQKQFFRGLTTDQASSLKAYEAGFKVMAEQVGKSLGYTGDSLTNFVNRVHSMKDIMSALGVPVESLTQATVEYNKALADAEKKNSNMSDSEKLKLLNVYRSKSGLSDATSITQGFSEATAGAAESAQLAADGIDSMTTAAESYDSAIASMKGADWSNVIKGAYTSASNNAFTQANALAQNYEKRVEDGISAAGQAQQDAYKAQEKNTSAYYDAQTKGLTAAQKAQTDAQSDYFKQQNKSLDAQSQAVQDNADAETKAIQDKIDALNKEDTVRQQLFDAEKTRIERMAQLTNNSIDFNAALNSGNLDAAAKVYSSNSAYVQQNLIDDQQKATDAASKAQQDALKARIDAINAEKDAKVKALSDQKSALADYQQAQQDALQQEQQNAKDSLDAQKQAAIDALTAKEDAASKATQNALTNQQETWANQQVYLNLQLDTLKASVPRTKGEYDTLISQIEAAYSVYGVNLQAQGDQWSGYLGKSLNDSITTAALSLQSDIGWQQIGAFIQSQIDSGSGVTMDTVVNYLRTGNWTPTAAPTTPQPWAPRQADNGFKLRAMHVGGQVGIGDGGISPRDRTGVPANAPLHPSETWVLAKRGEFLVNERSAQENLPLLEQINSGLPNSKQFLVRHIGGPIGLLSGNEAVAGLKLTSAALEQKAAATAMSQIRLAMQANTIGSTMGYTGGMPQSIAATLDFARQQQGKPYIWGGAGPAGADCSGFMSEIYNYLAGRSPGGNTFPWGRDFVTASFSGGVETAGFKRGGSPSNRFRIGVDPGSHMAGTLGGINVESGSGHGPMVGGRALGADSGFQYQYYLPMADLPSLYNGGVVQYDNTLANLHKKEAVLTAPLSSKLDDALEAGFGNTYHVEVIVSGPVNSQIDFERGVERALNNLENKRGRSRNISS